MLNVAHLVGESVLAGHAMRQDVYNHSVECGLVRIMAFI